MWSLFVLRQILHYSIQCTAGEGRQQGPWSCYNVVTTPHCLANCSPDIFISLLWLVTGTVDQLWGGGWVTMSWQTIIVLTRWRPLRWPELGRGQLVVSTGCPVKLSTLWFCCFLGFHITYRRTSDHFSIAQEMRISKLTLLYFLDEKLIKLQHKTWDKLDFESIILMADFASS